MPRELTSHIYVDTAEERQGMLNKKRFYYTIIPEIIKNGQADGEITDKVSAEEIFETYASIERGLIYDWCIKNGKGNLVENGRRLISPYLRSLGE